jgi:hypothetical protein
MKNEKINKTTMMKESWNGRSRSSMMKNDVTVVTPSCQAASHLDHVTPTQHWDLSALDVHSLSCAPCNGHQTSSICCMLH